MEVIDLVLQRARLEGIGCYFLLSSVGTGSVNGYLGRAPDVPGEVGEAHAPLPRNRGSFVCHDDRVEQHDEAGARARLRMAGHVHAERTRADADLRRGQADACGGRAHRVDKIGAEGFGLRSRLEGGCRRLEDGGRIVEDWPDGH